MPRRPLIHHSDIALLTQTSARSDRWRVFETFPDSATGHAAARHRMVSAETARGGTWRIVRRTEEILD